MPNALKYLYTYFRYPAYRDFWHMGLGIEARHRRSERYWRQHLNLSKDFQKTSLEGYSGGGTLLVLGAGHLLDIDIDLIKTKFANVALCDANPALPSIWKSKFKNSINTEFLIVEISGTLEVWTYALQNFLSKNKAVNGAKLCEFLGNLKTLEPAIPQYNEDVVFSVNVLSQIPIYWRDRAHRIIEKYWQLQTDEHGKYDRDLQEALEVSMQKLQLQHINLLKKNSPQYIILISDRYFLYYTKDRSIWQQEEALFTQRLPELEGYKKDKHDCWFWHIAPQGIEEQDYGCIHDVFALSYVRKSKETSIIN